MGRLTNVALPFNSWFGPAHFDLMSQEWSGTTSASTRDALWCHALGKRKEIWCLVWSFGNALYFMLMDCLKHTATDPRDRDACALEWAGLSWLKIKRYMWLWRGKTKQQNTTSKLSTELISITYDYVGPSYTVIMYAGNILPNEVHYAVDMLH